MHKFGIEIDNDTTAMDKQNLKILKWKKKNPLFFDEYTIFMGSNNIKVDGIFYSGSIKLLCFLLSFDKFFEVLTFIGYSFI